MKRVNIDGENLHIILNDSRNFNDDIFRKDVTYDNIKIKIKKTGPHQGLKIHSWKNQGVNVKLNPPAF